MNMTDVVPAFSTLMMGRADETLNFDVSSALILSILVVGVVGIIVDVDACYRRSLINICCITTSEATGDGSYNQLIYYIYS